ncbi:hypothetical protein PROFUN_07563 [Planoprotostelium fungivorum]|uniref:AAA+ ATPase domain-containing protein n=1 Tax=Planoprotostelium fungivorum TaxID=1890364 RepID=A0A2P6NLV3_9EUKA|nr:hypothetical protein PROFUN_07563 [Planoprotostelium fungivorum]
MSTRKTAREIVLEAANRFAPPPPANSSRETIKGIPQVLSHGAAQSQQEYFDKYTSLIQMVLDEENRALHEHLGDDGHKITSHLKASGFILVDLHATEEGSIWNEFLIKFYRERGQPIGFHKFEVGESIIISRMSHRGVSTVENTFDGVISSQGKREIIVSFKNPPKDPQFSSWRMDVGPNFISHDRMMAALHKLKDKPSAEVTTLKNMIMSEDKDIEREASTRSSLFTSSDIHNLPRDFHAWSLNQSQRDTVKKILGRRLSLIQGPPGTGKTHTTVQLVRVLLHILKNKSEGKRVPILCAADTNVAVDNLLEGLCNAKIHCLRIGQTEKIRREYKDNSVEIQVKKHPRWTELRDPGLQASLEREITAEILSSVDVICATCIGSGHPILKERNYPLVIVDESTQATEPATLCPLVRGSEMVVLLGDHFQLPPTVKSAKALEGGLGKSLFQRFVERGVKPFMLQIQYRMHPSIAEFPNRRFYDGKVENGKRQGTDLIGGFPWPSKEPLAFVPITDRDAKSNRMYSKSKVNYGEARVVVRVASNLVSHGNITAKEIGILSPYSGQVEAIRDNLRKYHLNDSITVNTVDGFQGREKEIILFSTVRNNDKKKTHPFKIGFLSDWRRLNVALTRARRGIIVFGNEETLRSNDTWSAWLDWMKEKDSVMTMKEVEGLLGHENERKQRRETVVEHRKVKREKREQEREQEEKGDDTEDTEENVEGAEENADEVPDRSEKDKVEEKHQSEEKKGRERETGKLKGEEKQQIQKKMTTKQKQKTKKAAHEKVLASKETHDRGRERKETHDRVQEKEETHEKAQEKEETQEEVQERKKEETKEEKEETRKEEKRDEGKEEKLENQTEEREERETEDVTDDTHDDDTDTDGSEEDDLDEIVRELEEQERLGREGKGQKVQKSKTKRRRSARARKREERMKQNKRPCQDPSSTSTEPSVVHQAEDKIEEKTEDKIEEKTEDKAEIKTEKTEDTKVEDKVEDKIEDKIEEDKKTEDKTEVKKKRMAVKKSIGGEKKM